MTHEDVDILLLPEVREAIEANICGDPLRIALDRRLPHAALVASQVKYLSRAARKLPTWYAARCIIPSLAFEQSSSEETAAHKDFSGRLCVDLTCGLGADSLALSRKFDELVSVERDGVLARVATVNFDKLEAANIHVVNMTAEDFLSGFVSVGRIADLIYIDPDRRGATGKKLVKLQDCSPDVVKLMPLLKKAARKIVIKASPLFDLEEVFRLFGDNCRAEAVSSAGECKEVVITIDEQIPLPTVAATALGGDTARFPLRRDPAPSPGFSPPYRYMIIPDVALRKARITSDYFAGALPGAFVTPGDGYVFSDRLPAGPVMGRIFGIVNMAPYSPGQLKASLKKRGIRSAEIYLHGFPQSTAQICRRLGIKEGGGAKLAFTRVEETLWTIELKELPLYDQSGGNE